ncbi:hypothetical protein BD310DRAFT_313358 [Dichomitus squalens]|uniref:Uncharacterized protein n=1 Tax=Dichomitus squalens TaxID=114155 RepID=A0A4Q9PCR3_9APHY|nr:hypothetical protein BD310DRAFT_313358 [Dichomitus squalens]
MITKIEAGRQCGSHLGVYEGIVATAVTVLTGSTRKLRESRSRWLMDYAPGAAWRDGPGQKTIGYHRRGEIFTSTGALMAHTTGLNTAGLWPTRHVRTSRIAQRRRDGRTCLIGKAARRRGRSARLVLAFVLQVPTRPLAPRASATFPEARGSA